MKSRHGEGCGNVKREALFIISEKKFFYPINCNNSVLEVVLFNLCMPSTLE